MVQISEGKRDIRPASRYLAGHTTISRPELDTEQGMLQVSSFLKDFGATGITCISEAIACRLHQYRELLPSGLDLWLPPPDVVQRVLSKRLQTEVARRVGLDVLPTYYIQSGEDIAGICREHFPVCLRPADPGPSKPAFKARVFFSPGDLARFVQSLQLSQPLMAQPFLDLPNLVLHGARSSSGRDMGLEAFWVPCKFQGVTLTMKRFKTSEGVIRKCINFVREMGITGSYHFEFLWDQGQDKLWFLEVNARLGGTTAKALACGYDEPAMILKAYGVLDNSKTDVQAADEVNSRTVSSRIALGKYFLKNLGSGLDILDYPQRSRFSNMLFALVAMLGCRDEVFSWSDLSGSLALWRASLKKGT